MDNLANLKKIPKEIIDSYAKDYCRPFEMIPFYLSFNPVRNWVLMLTTLSLIESINPSIFLPWLNWLRLNV